METKKGNRQFGLDIMAGIIILYVIICHMRMVGGTTPDFGLVLFLSMPWFYFKSGMFFKDKDIKDLLKADYKKLLSPYIAFIVIGWVVFVILSILKGTFTPYDAFLKPLIQLGLLGSCSGNWPLWFLLTLFGIKFVYTVLNKIFNNSVLGKVCIGSFGLAIAFIMCYLGISKFVYIASISLGLFFYMLGDLLRTKQYSIPLFIVSTIIYLALAIGIPSHIGFQRNVLVNGNYFACVIASAAGCIFFNNVLNRLFTKDNFFAKFGRESITYYVCHFPVVLILQYIFADVLKVENGQHVFYLTILGCIILLPLLNKLLNHPKLKFLIGK
jgi:hypothetical protein